jgi:hypothetical protein
MSNANSVKVRKPYTKPLVAALVALALTIAGFVVLANKPWTHGPNVSDRSHYNELMDPWSPDIVHEPLFDCPINADKPRTDKTTKGEADKLIPCWNAAFHVIVDKDGQPRIGAFTSLKATATVESRTPNEYDAYKRTGEDKWVFTVLSGSTDGHLQYDFEYMNGTLNEAIGNWQIYYRIGGSSEPWLIAGNFNDYATEPGEEMEAILLYSDPNRSTTLVRTPFNWRDVPKGWGIPHFADN